MATPVESSATDAFFGGFFCPCSFSPPLLLLFTFVWFVVHRLLGSVLPLVFLPAASRAVHREKWRRWKQLLLAQRQQQSVCGAGKADDLQHEQLTSKCQQQETSKRVVVEQQQRQPLLVKHLQQGPDGELRDIDQVLQAQRRKDGGQLEGRQRAEGAAEQQQEEHTLPQEKWRPSKWQTAPAPKQQQQRAHACVFHSSAGDRYTLQRTVNVCNGGCVGAVADSAGESFYGSCSAAATNDQAWMILSRDDAKGATLAEEEKWEGEEGLRRRVVPGSGEAALQSRTAPDAKEWVDAPRTEESTAGRSAGPRYATETAASAAEEDAAAGEASAAKSEEGLAAAASHMVAAAAEEGAAAVARESAEAAAAGEENDAAEKWRGLAESEEEELQLLEKYFVVSNANVVGMLHALYLAPTALYYSIRNVVLPAAEMVLAERAASAKRDATASSHAATAAAVDSEQLLSYHHLGELLHIYFLHWDKAPSFWDGSTDCVVILSAYVMTSYFVWDTVECFQNFKIHGRAFFFHALLSLLAGLLQVSARGIRLAGICSMFAVSEISTPFLHFRWFLIHNGQGSFRLCTMTTVWTVFLFILVRAVMVPCLVFSHYWGDIAFFHKYTLREGARISVLRALFMLALTVAWTALNLFWCLLFFRSLFKRRSRSNRSGGGRKQLIPGCRANSRRSSVRPSSTYLHQRNI